ncbi:hypothetical protein FA592_07370 [Sulfurospirillum diekertiae]|uniref:Uncharacterized protein n=1 Tax=Sulfurospirillum diekertiae TaxID=1854492 RepID=A0A6G9VRT4_9BACT|nr:DUF6622 family protein [Sulfurospirillum diekertiae]QIR76061.1 hypothetical protein FA584_07515 [Sulfurospirillum diekertiae]QIR78699.1 hypothetical protein FA592_07370 [Sulfurospirillum diekertiae]
MVLAILAHTPVWVFLLFGVLLILGWMQSRDRKVSYVRAFILPCMMIIFSIYGVASAFGMSIGIVAWSVGMMAMMALGIRIRAFYNVVFMAEYNAFAIKGSWLWLTLMMVIFWLKFAVGVALARELAIVTELWFILSVSLCYGLLSGIFLVRMVILWKIKSLHIKTI